ncbi:MAG: amidohydrolase [Pseudohongiellaceae bacterium]
MKRILVLISLLTMTPVVVAADTLTQKVLTDYHDHLEALFLDFHAHPELSFREERTAAIIADELRAVGFEVTERVGGTGIVAIMNNGEGPMVMVRADMDGLPVEEKSGLPYSSLDTQTNLDGELMPVMHACGHDVHITSLIGTARQMAATRDAWSGTLMLIGQPAEELVEGAKAMMEDQLWERFGKPDIALAFHVTAGIEAGTIDISDASPFSGSDRVDIIVHGVGAHGAAPHTGKDPVVLAAEIVMALQTLVSRELTPYEPGVVTVGYLHAGTKSNIISDRAELGLSVRSDNPETREKLLQGIKRIAENMGRVAGLPDQLLPTVNLSVESTPPTMNDPALAHRLEAVWIRAFGDDEVGSIPKESMGAEDFPYFTTDPHIQSVYFLVGGTSKEDLEREEISEFSVASHHSPLFKIEPEPAVTRGVEATVLALMDLMGKE